MNFCYECGELIFLSKNNKLKEINCPNCNKKVIINEQNKKDAIIYRDRKQEQIFNC